MFPNNTIFDVDAGLLDDELLAEQMWLLMGLVSKDQKGSGAPAPLVWQGHEDGLALRLNQLMEEMTLRGHACPDRVAVTDESILWPSLVPQVLSDQLEYLKTRETRAREGERARIRLPRNDHELWATYKYSILARNTQAYQAFGQRVAARSIPLDQLWLSMVNASRITPSRGGIRNALQHMWGYVSGQSTLNPQTDDLAGLARDIQMLSAQHQVSYLLNSTALGELRAWL